jgi:hypothetical protein
LATSHANNVTIAATIGVVNAYGPLQANVGAHDPMEMQVLALYRLMGNISGRHVPPPTPNGSESARPLPVRQDRAALRDHLLALAAVGSSRYGKQRERSWLSNA